jgi:hypothetical protein
MHLNDGNTSLEDRLNEKIPVSILYVLYVKLSGNLFIKNQAADHDIVVAVSTSMFANHPD